MLHSPLDNIALAYEPVWDKGRRICATRLTVHALDPKKLNVTQWLTFVTHALPPDAPPLLLNPVAPELLLAMLKQAPVRNTWLEVPEFIWAKPEARELLLHARRFGHQLLWRGELSRFGPYTQKFQGLRGMLDVSAEDALRALRSAQQGGEFSAAGAADRVESPIVAGQLYTGVASRAVADHALDKRQAWGVVGWPADELLSENERQPVPMDQRVMVQIMQALEAEVPIQQLGRLLVQDPVLVYRLLRMVNSAAFGLSHEVESIRHALMMLGYDKLRGWLRSAYGRASSDRSLHPVRHAMLLRARLMRLLLDANSDEELKAEVQLTGVFAQLDRLMHEPLAALLHQLPVPGRIFSTLVRRDGPYVAYLDVANAAADPARVADMPAICERSGFAMEEVNTAILELLATAREPTDQSFAPAANPSKHLA
jgi:c-di-GMP phosphodiesterase